MKLFVTILCITFSIITLVFPSICTSGMKTGIEISLYTILPSFFPFLVLTNLLIKYDLFKYISTFTYPIFHRLFKVSKNGSFVVLIGFTCGYPIGIKTARDMYINKRISYDEFLYLIKFCNNPSLPFIINYVAYNILNGSYKIWKLLLCIYLSSAMTGTIFSICSTHKNNAINKNNHITIPTEENIFISSFKTVANLSAYVLIFSIVISYMHHLLPNNSLFKTILVSLTEITSGINYIGTLSNPTSYLPLIIIALVSGGLSITFQSLSLLKNKTEFFSYFKGKLLSIILALLLYFIT